MLGKNAAGFVVPFDTIANAGALTSAGIAAQTVDNKDVLHQSIGPVGADGDLDVIALQGTHDLEIDAGDPLVFADAPCACYGADNQTVSKTSAGSTRSIAGLFLGVNSETNRARVVVGPLGHALAKGTV